MKHLLNEVDAHSLEEWMKELRADKEDNPTNAVVTVTLEGFSIGKTRYTGEDQIQLHFIGKEVGKISTVFLLDDIFSQGRNHALIRQLGVWFGHDAKMTATAKNLSLWVARAVDEYSSLMLRQIHYSPNVFTLHIVEEAENA